MDLKLAGKTVLITGASRGIGRATAEIFAGEGCNLIMVARNAADLDSAKAEIAGKSKVRIETIAADISDSANVGRLARDFSKIDILVNNAGGIPGGTLLEMNEAKWRAAWNLKVFGYINMCRAFYAVMQARRAGVIVNVIGHAAITRDPEYICGVTGNAALTAFTQALGSVSSRDGIRIVGVSPGPVLTERLLGLMRKKAKDRTGDAETWPAIVEPMPFGRAATPAEIGAAIAFLASEHSAYTSGEIAVIDGGLSSRTYSY